MKEHIIERHNLDFIKPNIILGKVYDQALGRSNFYGYKLGCGDCTSMRNKNIPCMACTSNTCNRWKLLTDESIMCWGGDRVLTCPRETTGRVCHYAVIKETIGLFCFLIKMVDIMRIKTEHSFPLYCESDFINGQLRNQMPLNFKKVFSKEGCAVYKIPRIWVKHLRSF